MSRVPRLLMNASVVDIRVPSGLSESVSLVRCGGWISVIFVKTWMQNSDVLFLSNYIKHLMID